MENRENIQLVKEQLKIKNTELKKQAEEKNKINEQIKNVLSTNLKKMNNLKSQLQEKKEALRYALSQASSETQQPSEPAAVKGAVVQDPKFLAELEKLRKRDKELTALMKAESAEKEKFFQDKNVLLKEMHRVRKDPQSLDNLKNKISQLTSEIKRFRDRSSSLTSSLQNRIQEKNEIIASYEQMSHLGIDADEEGVPTGTVLKLQKELVKQQEEKKKMEKDLEGFQELVNELEVKISMLQEGDAAGTLEQSGVNPESRASQAAEFGSGMEGFLVTYSDVVALILVIFVMMFTFSNMDEEKFAEAISSFQAQSSSGPKDWRTIKLNIRLSKKEFKMLQRVRELVKDNVEPEDLVRGDTTTTLVSLPSGELFTPGSADFTADAEQLIRDAIQEHMNDVIKQVIVSGHTDNVPMVSAQFPSNWELSSARASSVARFIAEKIGYPPELMVVSGYGPYRPLQPNTSDANRAINRRVEIKILKDREILEETEASKKQEGQEGQTQSEDQATEETGRKTEESLGSTPPLAEQNLGEDEKSIAPR